MSVQSKIPPGTHEMRVNWSSKGRTVPQKVFTFDVVNPYYGKEIADPDVEALKRQHRGCKVILLQQGAPCKELNVKEYTGCTDSKMHATHRVNDRNSDWVNYGGTDLLDVGHYGQERRSLIRFDLGQLPKRAKVKKAYLRLFMYQAPGRDGKGHPELKYAYPLLRPWGEGVGNGSIFDKTNGKIRQGECSWKTARHPEAWGAPGCDKPGVDREEKPVAVSRCDEQKKDTKGRLQPVKKVWVKWDVTGAVADWLKEPQKNHGLLLAVGRGETDDWGEKIARVAVYFRSSEYFDPPFRPKLIIAYGR